jgi:hypothetical protein
MPFEPKSAGAMYQRSIQRCIHTQLRCNTEVYVDDVVIMTPKDEGLISDLAETFDNMKKFKIQLNPEKCMFECPQESYSCIWSPGDESTITQRRCQLSPR